MTDEIAALRRAVAARRPIDDRERESIERFLVEIERLVEPFSETADPVHVTASAIVTSDAGVLLHRHRRLGIWLQPGGHIEVGETPAAAALREAYEETGLACRLSSEDIYHVDVHPGPKGHTHLDVRFHLVADGEPRPPAGESPDVRWFSWDDAIAIADAGLVGALQALRPTR